MQLLLELLIYNVTNIFFQLWIVSVQTTYYMTRSITQQWWNMIRENNSLISLHHPHMLYCMNQASGQKVKSVELANIHNYYYKHYKEASCTVKLVYTYIQSLYTNWCTYISINSLSTVKLDYKVLQSICKPV